jgi:hypothetical protein
MAIDSHQQGGNRLRKTPAIAAPAINHTNRNRELNVVFASSGCTHPKLVQDLLPQLANLPDISIRAILDDGFRGQDFITASSCCMTLPNVKRQSALRDVSEVEQEAVEICEWADLMVRTTWPRCCTEAWTT